MRGKTYPGSFPAFFISNNSKRIQICSRLGVELHFNMQHCFSYKSGYKNHGAAADVLPQPHVFY
jgi:hypothetical protein